MSVHAFTSCSYSYLNRARVLAATLRRHHPDWVIWMVMTDKPPQDFTLDLDAEDYDKMVTAEDLFGPGLEQWLFTHDIVEACTAVKAQAAAHILNEPDCDKLFYFDPDIAIFNVMDPLVDMLDEYSIVLTPHQAEPDRADHPTAVRDNEIVSLSYGTYNLGFLGLANDEEARRFVAWWCERLRDWCHDRLSIGLFVDQKWCNLIPCFFDGVKVVRDPGYNVASWNLSRRTLTYSDAGMALINGLPLRFYHFTKLGPVGDTMTRRYAKNNIEVYELWWWYKSEVIAATSDKIPKGYWHYGVFDNGEKIPKAARELYRERRDVRNAFPSPFQAGPKSLYGWLQAQTDVFTAPERRGFVPA